MPELPEVESLRVFLQHRIVGLDVEKAVLSAFSALKTFDPPLDAIVGRKVGSMQRRGKYLIFEMVNRDDAPIFLVLHLARGGWLKWQEEMKSTRAKPGGKGPMALQVTMDDGSGFNVTEAGTEKRLAIWVARDVEDIEMVHTLGPDVLDNMTASQIGEILRKQKGQIKRVLTEQRVLAGVGNAYSDEALHVAKLSPFKAANKLTEEESETLSQAVIDVLTDAVRRSADVPVSGLKSEKKSGMRVHGRTGEACPVCGDTIREVSYSSKSFQYCPTCQTGGKPLADRRMSRLLK